MPNSEAHPAWQGIPRENSCLAAEVLLQPYAFSRVRRQALWIQRGTAERRAHVEVVTVKRASPLCGGKASRRIAAGERLSVLPHRCSR